jgi:hypothetical protein
LVRAFVIARIYANTCALNHSESEGWKSGPRSRLRRTRDARAVVRLLGRQPPLCKRRALVHKQIAKHLS